MTDNPAQDPGALAKEANAALRASQNAMFSGKHDQAAEQLEVANQAITHLRGADPGHKDLKNLEQKLGRQQADLDRRRPKPAQPAAQTAPPPRPSAPAQPSAAPTPSATTPAAGLPANFLRRLKLLGEALDQVEAGLQRAADHPKPEEQLKAVRMALASAQGDGSQLVEQIGKDYFKGVTGTPPELETLLARTGAIEAKVASFEAALATRRAGEAEAKARVEALSNTWVARLAPFVTGLGRPGHDPAKYLIPTGTANPDELAERKRIWEQASAEFALYRQADFPEGRTAILQDIERELERALAQFEQAYLESLGDLTEAAEKEIDQAQAHLASRSAWRDDPKLKPIPLAQNHLERIQAFLDQAAKAVPEGDARLVQAKQKYATLIHHNEETRKAMVERTYMTPDRFSGFELEELRVQARVAAAAHAMQATLLRATVISPAWNEEDVVEYTDTSRTEIRRRITHSVTAQVAATLGDETLLYTIQLAKDRRTDGSFGPLQGHVQFTDRMLAQNVEKSAP